MQQKRKRQKYYSTQPSPRTSSLARLSVPPPLVARAPILHSSPARPPPVRPDAPPLHTRPTFQSLAANGNDRRGHGASLHLRLLGPPPPPPPIPGLHRPSPASTAPRCCSLGPPPRAPRLRTARPRVSLTSDVSSSSDVAEEEAEHAPKVGRRVRVTAPLRVYHAVKAPDLDIQGMEGVIKQYVGVWKGKRITANFPFKVEFQLAVDTQPKPVKLFVHLREDEFEYIDDE